MFSHRLVGTFLDTDVEGRLHDQHAVAAQLAGIRHALDLAEGPVEVVIGGDVAGAGHRRRRVAQCRLNLAFGNEAGFHHVVEHVHRARARAAGRFTVRRVFRRRLEQAGQHRGLGEAHVLQGLAEIVIGRRHRAEGAAAHIGAVEIELENVVLAEMALEPQRQERLVHFALQRALVGEEQVLGELLGDGGAALRVAAAARIRHESARRADRVDAPMLVEAPVLGGDQRLDHAVGKVVELQRIVVLDPAPPHLDAVAVEEGDGEILLLQPVLAGEVEGGLRQGQHQNGATGPERHRFAGEIKSDTLPAAHREDLHAFLETLVGLGGGAAAVVQARIHPGIEAEGGVFQARQKRGGFGQAHDVISVPQRTAGTAHRCRRSSTTKLRASSRGPAIHTTRPSAGEERGRPAP